MNIEKISTKNMKDVAGGKVESYIGPTLVDGEEWPEELYRIVDNNNGMILVDGFLSKRAAKLYEEKLRNINAG